MANPLIPRNIVGGSKPAMGATSLNGLSEDNVINSSSCALLFAFVVLPRYPHYLFLACLWPAIFNTLLMVPEWCRVVIIFFFIVPVQLVDCQSLPIYFNFDCLQETTTSQSRQKTTNQRGAFPQLNKCSPLRSSSVLKGKFSTV